MRSPEEEAKQFDRAMEHVRRAYASINSIFSKANKIDHLIDAHAHLSNAMREISEEVVQEVLDRRGASAAPVKNRAGYRVNGNLIRIDWAKPPR